jgi:hypothetical protein
LRRDRTGIGEHDGIGENLTVKRFVRLFRKIGSVNRYNNFIFFAFSHPRIAHYFLSYGKGDVYKM